MNSQYVKDKIIHALKVARTKTIYFTAEQDAIDDALKCLEDHNVVLSSSDDYNEGFSHGHACAWEQAIMVKEVDIKTIKIDPQDFGNTGFMSAHTQGWNDCLNHIAACNYRIVK